MTDDAERLEEPLTAHRLLQDALLRLKASDNPKTWTAYANLALERLPAAVEETRRQMERADRLEQLLGHDSDECVGLRERAERAEADANRFHRSLAEEVERREDTAAERDEARSERDAARAELSAVNEAFNIDVVSAFRQRNQARAEADALRALLAQGPILMSWMECRCPGECAEWAAKVRAALTGSAQAASGEGKAKGATAQPNIPAPAAAKPADASEKPAPAPRQRGA